MNITQDQLSAAEEAFGTHIVEPYIGMRMKTGKKFNKTHALIYDLYKRDKDIVNDEMMLVCDIWQGEGWIHGHDLLWNLRRVTHPETISRRRRELHEAGLIEYSNKAMKIRTDAFKSERSKASPLHPVIVGVDFSNNLSQAKLL